MAEHHELVAEMSTLEQMGTQERQKLAKKRRLQQLKKWAQREKEWIAKEKHLNKRLASILHEENNGLNLKQYTSYGSNLRSKKKLQLTADKGVFKANHDDHLNKTSLTPKGRVHFNVGVMLLEAAARNDFDEVKRLLMLGVSPDSVNHDGLTALHQCCIDSSEPIMNLLLEFGANVDARDTEQWTPLHAACTCGHLNLVKILVQNGADLLAVNGDGNMPFDICEDESTLDFIEFHMMEKGITQEMIDFTRASTEMKMMSDIEKRLAEGQDLNGANENGITLLHIATANGYLPVVKCLLKHGVNVNICDNDLWRPLHGAACWGNEQHIQVVDALVEAGANFNAKTINDETVFDLCSDAKLLERLNQIKDEFESKKVSGADRLRRTQSRTNSRIHSVRRTSVRDKNQISRREAREEALLRVDSSPSLETNKHPLANGQSSGFRSSSMDSSIKIEASEDVVDSDLKSESNKKGDMKDPMKDCRDKPNGESANNTNDRSHMPSNNNTSVTNNRKPMLEQAQIDGSAEGILNGLQGSKCVKETSDETKPERGENLTSNHVVDKTAYESGVDVIGNEQDYQNSNDVALCDPNEQPTPLPAVQFAPFNYTLANLKKQRSDLRMRTTSIGGNGHQILLEHQPMSELNPHESANAGYRKFSGEPSDLFGNGKRGSRHNCCTLI